MSERSKRVDSAQRTQANAAVAELPPKPEPDPRDSDPVTSKDETPFWQGLDKAQSGIFVEGQVIARTRQKFKQGEKDLEKVIYRITNAGPDLLVEDVAPPGYLTIGTLVKLPIYIRPWKRKNGTPAFSVSIARPMADRGEEF